MPQHDQLHRYLFENFAVRGELVTVSETLQQILENHDYPQPVKNVLAELLVATSLLTATLKFDGDITVQLQGDGPMNLAVINGNNNQQMRGVARVQGEIPENADLKTLVGNGYVVITITPSEGERYQGVVGLEGDTTAACTEDYFMRSEQLPTRLFIRTGDVDGKPAAGGMLLQVMPAQNANRTTLTTGDANRNHQNRRTADLTGKRSVVAFVSRRRGDGLRSAGCGVQMHLLA